MIADIWVSLNMEVLTEDEDEARSVRKGVASLLCSSQWKNDADSGIYSTVKFSPMPNNISNFACLYPCLTRDSNPEPPAPQIGGAPTDCATGDEPLLCYVDREPTLSLATPYGRLDTPPAPRSAAGDDARAVKRQEFLRGKPLRGRTPSNSSATRSPATCGKYLIGIQEDVLSMWPTVRSEEMCVQRVVFLPHDMKTYMGKAVIDFVGGTGPAAPILADQQARTTDVRRGARQTHPRRSEGKPSQTANIFSTSYGTVDFTFVRCAGIAVTIVNMCTHAPL
ncbi:hypothetical protein PR048_024538 [Dryococelus australis]|uniref:Uncharacterized protein n=1 Tax=Dryococelus australis TaxID=614101 RepID=A0ABQ9GNU3_9NEOP|nr:hypothetical protein PR048_024538 [Dryococelus australis]